METVHDLVCEALKSYSYKLNVDDEQETNLYDAYINGDSITNKYVQSVFRNVAKRIDKSVSVSFSAEYSYMAVIIIRNRNVRT